MTCACRIVGVLVLLAIVLQSSASELVYRRYEKVNKRKNYVHVVEVFGTLAMPPAHIQNDKELNDFLGRDAYKTDMNCTKLNETRDAEVITKPTTTTTRLTTSRTTATPTTRTTTQRTTTSTKFPTIPTTAYRLLTTPAPNATQRVPSGWDFNLFPLPTPRPDIRENPRENKNPDYSDLEPKHNATVQVTKIPTAPKVPTIVIVESDDHPTKNQTTLFEVDNESHTKNRNQTPGDEIYYLGSDEKTEDVEVDPGDVEYDTDDDEENDDEDYGEDNVKRQISRQRRKKSSTH